MPNFNDILWTAGFLEGEGSFVVWTDKYGNKRPKIAAAQVNREPLERLARIWGGTINISKRAEPPRQELLAWTLWHTRAAAVMRAVRPFMSRKRREQIDRALAVDTGILRLQQTHCVHGHVFDEENTYYTKSGSRSCRACHRVWSRQSRQRLAERLPKPHNRGHGRPRGRKVRT